MCTKPEDKISEIQECIEKHNEIKEILVSGNGFDLHHYLPTRYIDYIKVVKRLLELDEEGYLANCGYLKFMFGDYSPVNASDEYIKMCHEIHSDTIVNTPLDYSQLEKLVEIAKRNMWIQYFLDKTREDMQWIDFEKEISKVVYAVICYMDLLKSPTEEELNTGLSISKDGISAEDYVILLKFKEIFIKSKSGIRVENKYIISDESGMRIKIDEEKIIEKLIEELEELTESLAIYVEQFVQNITTNKKSSNTLFEKMDLVINFNYTNTFEALKYSDAKIHYIHGSSCAKNIVLGINDDDKDTVEKMDLRFIAFKKYYQRVVKKTNYLMTDILKDEEKYHLNFVGHSLDITDRDIVTSLIMSDKVSSSKIFYHNTEAFKQQVINLVSMFGKEKFEQLLYQNKIEFEELAPFRN